MTAPNKKYDGMTDLKTTKIDDVQDALTKELERVDRDRFLACAFAAEKNRPGLWALLAFNAELSRVREAVTQPVLGQIRLQWWRDVLDAIYSKNTIRRHPVAEKLAECVYRHELSFVYLQQLIDAREQDLLEIPFGDMAALTLYVAGTGSSLTAARLEVMGATGVATRQAGDEIGAAWALTGIIRAIPFHARFRRVLIPGDLLEAAGIDAEALFAGHAQSTLPEAVEQLATLARRRLQAGRALRRHVDRAALPALLEARLADRYLNRIEAAGYDPFHPSVAEPLPMAAWHLLTGAILRRY